MNAEKVLLIIHVSSDGVEKVSMPVSDIKDTVAAKALHSRCASIIALLSRAARGSAE